MDGPSAARRRRPERLDVLSLEWFRLDRLAGLGGLLAEVAHEVRNPLSVLRSLLALLPERAADPDFREPALWSARPSHP